MRYLITQTIRVATSDVEDDVRYEWATALQRLINQADGLHTQHTQFNRDLLDITLDHPSNTTHDSPYAQTSPTSERGSTKSAQATGQISLRKTR
jgi:phenylalanyl-tRNA synthetase alpha subunit